MKLVGNYLSPYVRRVAVSLASVGLPFELQHLYVFKEPDTVRSINPVVRIPALVLDDGEVLVESYAILDEIDQIMGPEQALTPPSGEHRRKVMKITAVALAAAEKAQWAFYEGRFRPPEKVHQPWIEHNESQVIGGFEFLEGLASQGEQWLAKTPRLSQADITTTVAFTFAAAVRPHMELHRRFPHLAGFASRCEALPPFRNAPLPEPSP